MHLRAAPCFAQLLRSLFLKDDTVVFCYKGYHMDYTKSFLKLLKFENDATNKYTYRLFEILPYFLGVSWAN